MALEGSARSTSAPLPSMHEAGAKSTAVAAGQCARRKAAPLVQSHAASAPSMVLRERARLQDAPPTHKVVDLRIAANTAAETSRAPWRAAPPPPNARDSAQSTVAGKASACLAVAPTRWWETCGRLA